MSTKFKHKGGEQKGEEKGGGWTTTIHENNNQQQIVSLHKNPHPLDKARKSKKRGSKKRTNGREREKSSKLA